MKRKLFAVMAALVVAPALTTAKPRTWNPDHTKPKIVGIMPNIVSPEEERADAPYVFTIAGSYRITGQDVRAIANCYISGSPEVRSAITALVEPEAGDTTPINEQLESLAADLTTRLASNPKAYQLVTTHLSSFTDEVKTALEACLGRTN